MPKEVKVNYSYTDAQYLVQFWEDGKYKGWKLVNKSEEVGHLISRFYHPTKRINKE